ncbi:hypothetical protein EUGRSUZ_E00647 [Eucalyptus grandis]|uniref:Uncharacterized protein n=2 Tax=Eucalyptus grandis TaxID=71139 RepID=A0ACC3KS73_EUCGR|nr:hypothetical protein EUGRSUZ_E00647 [Eucalyptus grandis]
MAHTITFSCLPSSCRSRMNSGTGDGGIALTTSIFERRSQFAQKEIKMQGIRIHDRHKLTLPCTMRNETHPTPRSNSPGERASQLYERINDKKWQALEEIISEDCCFEDYSFPTPFKGNKEVLLFFKQLTSSMGNHVKFNPKHISDDDKTAWVNWHLEWKGNEIPFTRGCSFYECSKDGDRLVIRKAQVFVESPIKPGGIVLILLKNITSLFDNFPTQTERFLKSPHAIVQWAMRIYYIFLAPFISTLLESYINSWKLMARMLSYALSMIIFILKLFFH